MLKERPCLSCKVLCRHFPLQREFACEFFIRRSAWKSSIFVGFPMSWTRIRRPRESLYYLEFFRYYRTFVLLVSRMSSLEMNHGSFCTIPVIRDGRRHDMKCQKKSVKKLAQNSVSFHLFSLSMESTNLSTFRKAVNIIQHPFMRLWYEVCLTELFAFKLGHEIG
jgi:hypothetical protein